MKSACRHAMAASPRALICTVIGLLLTVSAAWADPIDDQALGIARDLQCPICQGLSVADSPSQLAVQMRGVIRDKLQAGESRDAILAYFAERYGESVLMSPPGRGFTAFVWIAPYIAVIVAVGIVGWVVLRRSSTPTVAPPEGQLATYFEEVDQAFGELRDRPLR
jgi:cytochrome c-type biogenesis protein CcmH